MFLGIDIGTGSSKAVLVSPDGRILDRTSITHAADLPRPGWVEFDANTVWWPEIAALAQELLSRNDAGDLQGVCVSGMGPCLVVTDDSFTPLRPAILYGVDTRATEETAELTTEFGPQWIFDTCGKELSSQSVGPKLRWLKNHEPDTFAHATHWFGLNSYIVAKLTGEYVQDHHSASQCDPLYDVANCDWAMDAVTAVAGHLKVPRLVWSTEVVGKVTPAAAEFTGIPVETPVCAGTVDAWAEAFSAGVEQPGDLMLMYGSTMFFVHILSEPRTHHKLWACSGVTEGALTLAAGMSTSGSLVSWMQHLFGDVPLADLIQEAESVPAGSEGLLVLPHFAGERAPILDPDARGTIIGLTMRHGRAHLLRAAYEGMAYGIRQILELLESTGEPVRRLVAVGGGTNAPLWTKVVSDITGRTQIVPRQTIGASYGDALMAAIGTGAVPKNTVWAEPDHIVEPDQDNAVVYERLFATYSTLYPAIRGQMHELAGIQRDTASCPEQIRELPGQSLRP
ncbi:FGGY-family carbohydrate kinase [Arthrobacter monumenti]